jgi:mannose-6-phosphate isomerase-like protein (cupin superfamily)
MTRLPTGQRSVFWPNWTAAVWLGSVLPAGRVSQAVEHRTVEEISYVVSGAGEMWRSQGGREEVVPLSAGLSMTIPVGTRFQFRAVDGRTLFIVGVTIPRWPGPEEAQLREGRYSIHQSDRDVFHKHSDCPSGKQIPAQNKRLGTNIYPLCKHCRDK